MKENNEKDNLSTVIDKKENEKKDFIENVGKNENRNNISEISFKTINQENEQNGKNMSYSQNSTNYGQIFEKENGKNENFTKANENNIIHSNNAQEKEVENHEQNIQKIENEIEKVKVNNKEQLKVQKNTNINDNNISHNIIIEKEKICKKFTNLEYFQKQLKKYQKLKIPVCLLEEIIKEKRNFTSGDISYIYYNNFKLNPKEKLNDKILEDLLSKLELNKEFVDSNKYGYFCYKDIDGEYIESLYSTINNEIIYDFTNKRKLCDDYQKPNEFIHKEYIKSRALTLEYYIDKTIFEKKYNSTDYPRIIFPLQRIKKNKKNYVYDNYFYRSEIEIDGAFLINKDFNLETQDFPFINQYCSKYEKYTYNNDYNNKIIIKRNHNTFQKDDICILEIKTQFPLNPKDNTSLIYNYNEKPKTLVEVVNELLSKMYVFEQLFDDNNLNINFTNIRLILFYDLIKKRNFYSEINNTMKTFYNKNKSIITYFNKITFQVIYMNSNYFAGSLKYNSDKIDNLNYKIDNLTQENINLNKKIYNLTQENINLNKKIDNLTQENNGLKSEIIKLNKKFEKMNCMFYKIIPEEERKKIGEHLNDNI